jgi:hypothetical protein
LLAFRSFSRRSDVAREYPTCIPLYHGIARNSAEFSVLYLINPKLIDFGKFRRVLEDGWIRRKMVRLAGLEPA